MELNSVIETKKIHPSRGLLQMYRVFDQQIHHEDEAKFIGLMGEGCNRGVRGGEAAEGDRRWRSTMSRGGRGRLAMAFRQAEESWIVVHGRWCCVDLRDPRLWSKQSDDEG
jgi:hypothetical protein